MVRTQHNSRGKHRATADPGEVQPCYYCGMPADTIDHVVPRAFLEMLEAMGHEAVAREISHRRVLTVPACRECNSVLGCDIQPDLATRKRVAKDHILRKYHRFLECPAWTKAELDELGRNLRSYVERGESIRDLTRKRLEW